MGPPWDQCRRCVGFAVGWGSVASGVLAVPVADDERFPECGWDGAGGAADVEDLAGSGGDDAADVAVAGEASEGRGGEVAVVAGFGADAVDVRVAVAGEVVEVDGNTEVLTYRAGVAELAAHVPAPHEEQERVGASLRDGPGVVGPMVALHFDGEGPFEEAAVGGVVEAVEGVHAVERL